jgi:hypothetical protein
MVSFRHFLYLSLVVGLLAGGVPYFTCTPAVCAANIECSSAHCGCCGPNCPWKKNSQQSHKGNTACNQQCPLSAAGNAVTISNVRPLAAVMFSMAEVEPCLFTYTVSCPLPVCRSADLDPPTLLRLCCALTI